jgi:DNA recombination protein RmuC
MDLTAALLLAAAVFLLGILIGLLSGMRVASRRQTDASPGEIRRLREQLSESERQRAAVTASREAEEKHHREQIGQLQNARNQLLSEFSAAAERIVDLRQKQLRDDGGRQIETLINPLKEQIRNFSDHLQEFRAREAQERGFLKRELEQLAELNRQMSDDAKQLSEALRGNNKTMGTWGEVILERVLESSGLERGREYELQKSFQAEDGRSYRPDAVLYLPEDRNVIIDSKVSLLSYERAFHAASEEERTAHISRHLDSLRQHIRELSAKPYAELRGLNAPDFVLMFVPVEGALGAAQQADPSLFQQGLDQRILLVSPTTLYLSLRIVEQMWKGDRQQRNARIIAKKAGALYDKFHGFIQDMQKIGDKLDEARSAWISGSRKLSSGRGNLINRIQVLKDLGAESSKEIQEIDLKEEN